MMSAIRLFAVSAILTSLVHVVDAGQQPASANLAFEAVSIRRNVSGSGGMSMGVQPGGRFVAVNATMLTLVQNAYPFEQFRILNAPGWATSERYDVTAVA